MPTNGYIYAFPKIQFEAGKISAVAKANGKIVAQDGIETAGEPEKINSRRTFHRTDFWRTVRTSRFLTWKWWMRKAAAARPTRRAWISNWTARPSGAAATTAARPGSINNLYLNTECGINRVAIRSTLTPGTIALTATREGLVPATIQITSSPIAIKDGLMR